MKKELNTKRFFNLLAFVALIVSGVALLISKIFLGNSTTANVLNNLAYVLAFVVTAVSAYGYVRTRRSMTMLIIYIIAVIFVVIPLIISIFHI